AAREKPGMLPGLSQVDAPTLPGMRLLELTSAAPAATGTSPEEYPTGHAPPYLGSRGACTTAGPADAPDGSRTQAPRAAPHGPRRDGGWPPSAGTASKAYASSGSCM